ncbi:hypothetical protein BDN70DRAFT_117750 [Pholiota conissans]|uniref:Uncharacterized protein n=1 Tax=Pholiota conissans TaxID=109636 RepID=A0A9P5YY45_9AGAR|nr:hypothetical protein BDN70DRAFT_117750 [Pholiota conissans]
MHTEDWHTWKQHEVLLVTVAEKIRIWYKIPGNMPPVPLFFNYHQVYKSSAIAKKNSLARDWFTIWMGFVSYLLSSSERYSPSSS